MITIKFNTIQIKIELSFQIAVELQKGHSFFRTKNNKTRIHAKIQMLCLH